MATLESTNVTNTASLTAKPAEVKLPPVVGVEVGLTSQIAAATLPGAQVALKAVEQYAANNPEKFLKNYATAYHKSSEALWSAGISAGEAASTIAGDPSTSSKISGIRNFAAAGFLSASAFVLDSLQKVHDAAFKPLWAMLLTSARKELAESTNNPPSKQ